MLTAIPAVDPDALREQFRSLYQQEPCIVFAPGRVNLIGDHIDYCGGLVLPMPISQGTWVAIAPRDDRRIQARSLNVEQRIEFIAAEPPAFTSGHWGQFVGGAVCVLGDQLKDLPGADLLVAGNIPASGLSSSASLSVALLAALCTLVDLSLPARDLARLAQRIEHDYVGVNCGLMDQLVITLGQADSALLLDCAQLQAGAVPMHSDSCTILVADSGVPRKLADSAYNNRYAAMQTIAGILNIPVSATATVLNERHQFDDPVLQARARHVMSEQARTSEAVAALETADYPTFGRLLQSSHHSLRDDYQVSCPELDLLAETFSAHAGCYGARMTGAGFGGAVVAAVAPDAVAACSEKVAADYLAATGIETRIFQAVSRGGVQRLG